MSERPYDQLGSGYDSIIDWEARLGREEPFYRELFECYRARSVLDSACGTGEHAALFASWGLEVVGADLSEAMLAVARGKGISGVQWVRAGFGETYEAVGRTFDAVTCLGNSFPHVLTEELARTTVEDFARLLHPGGVLVVQQLNYEAMRRRGERFLGPESRVADGRETLFLRVFDLDRDPIRFTIVRMTREEGGWARAAWEMEHRAWSAEEMGRLLGGAGFASVAFFGDFAKAPFEASESDQLIVVAER